jgi:hypothetical protein
MDKETMRSKDWGEFSQGKLAPVMGFDGDSAEPITPTKLASWA